MRRGEWLGGLWAWLEARLPAGASNNLAFAMALLVAFLAVAAVGVFQGGRRAPSARKAVQRVEIGIHGTVTRPGEAGTGSSLSPVRFVFHFPELPLDLERSAAEVGLDAQGRFRVRFSFSAARLPRRFFLDVSQEGYETRRLGDLPLDGHPLESAPLGIVLHPSGWQGGR